MEKPQPIYLVDLLPQLDDLLIHFLEDLSIKEWELQTIAPKWKVKDVAVHLLDGNLRTLSMLRDNYYGEKAEVNSYSELVEFLNQLNADWVQATRRLSPKVIIDLLKASGKEYCDYLKSIDPHDKAVFSVAWAGENESQNWFHIAREYTEKWHHQQQIRLAAGKTELLLEDEWSFPYLDTSVRALPHHYRSLEGEQGDVIKFVFRGKTDKVWFLKYHKGWELYTHLEAQPRAEVIIKDEIAWRIFTKGIKKEDALDQSKVIGKKVLGLKVFDMLAVMA
ncbi:MAG: maleylpyruvate isomerase N-terminal domain-containing protein [Bacteroidota bacterium]